MDLTPIISIVIPVYNAVYNAEKSLSECISSVLNQSFTSFELLLVDDGSVDSSLDVCNAYAQKDLRVKVIHKIHAGVSAARNTGIKAAAGKYLMFIDSDDLLPEGALKKLYDLIKNDNYDVVFGQHVLDYSVRQIPKAARLAPGVYSYQDIKSNLIDDGTLTGFLFGNVWAAIYQRSPILNNNILFDEKVEVNEDGLFNFLLLSRCNKIFVTKEIVYIYRKWKTAKTRTLTKNKKFDACQQVLKGYIGLLGGNIGLLDGEDLEDKGVDGNFELQMQRREISILFWNALRIEESSCSWKEAKIFLAGLLQDKSVTCNFDKLDYARMNKYKKVLSALLQRRHLFAFYFLVKYVVPILQRRVKR